METKLNKKSSTKSKSGRNDKFTPKRKRQYKHILKSELDEGKPEKTAKRIAAETVNKKEEIKGN